MKKIVVSVSNDLATDQRVSKVCSTLKKNGFDILLVGRKLKNSLPVDREYPVKRFKMFFKQGPLFYAAYNFRLFIYLLFIKTDVLLANDLDTLPANFFVSRIKRLKLVYDSHELFTEVPELVSRPKKQRIWLKMEQKLLPGIHAAYTVCNSISAYYYKKYGLRMEVVRNVPYDSKDDVKPAKLPGLKDDRIIVYQGSVNIGRGLERVIDCLPELDGVKLMIIGDGDIMQELKMKTENMNLQDRVVFIGKVPPDLLPAYTKAGHLGISLEENMGLNYYFALPNKLFDYLHAGLPILVSPFPEMQKIVESHDVGCVADPGKSLVYILKEMLFNESKRKRWQDNASQASKLFCWEKEEEKLMKVFSVSCENSIFHQFSPKFSD